LCWRAYDLDVLGVRWRGVRAAANADFRVNRFDTTVGWM
jgi:hypothetical protein